MAADMWDHCSPSTLIHTLFMLDKGDKSSVISMCRAYRHQNEQHALDTLKAFKKILSTEKFSLKPVLNLLQTRVTDLVKIRSFRNDINQLSAEEMKTISMVATCIEMGVEVNPQLNDNFKQILTSHKMPERCSNELYLHTENRKMVDISKLMPSRVVLDLWERLKKNPDLNASILPNISFSNEDFRNIEGLKDILFLYLIRYLETQNRFNKIYCHHLETMIQDIINKGSVSEEESNDLKTVVDMLGKYFISTKVPGYCLVLCSFVHRDGAKNELRSTTDTFEKLGYVVEVIADPTVRSVGRHLEKMERTRYSFYDSFVLWIMSHGDEDGIKLSDGMTYDRKQLIDDFSKRTAFKRKPKLFFITTCQGSEKIQLQGHGSMYVETDSASITIPTERENLTAVYYEMDRIVAFSTLPNQYSYRNTKQGSYYVDIVCDLLESNQDRDITTVLQKVTQEVHKILFQTDLFSGKAKQASFYSSTLQKSLCIPPLQELK